VGRALDFIDQAEDVPPLTAKELAVKKLVFVLGLAAATLSVSCATTRRGASRGGGTGGVVDGARWKDPGPTGRVRNTFNTFRM
jgi:hypothetical protein